MTTRKAKNLNISLFKIKEYRLSTTLQILCDRTKDKENIYTSSHFVYKNKRIHVSSNRYRHKAIQNKECENIETKIKELMEKNKSISTKEISKQTSLSKHMIGKFYMKLRRNLNGRIK